mmetsp:Transcript_28632/g.54794  ORF Transcript_28632/g.54794 Transcript_28632/m.54794 type:complete len:273 (+) Transcript_28632:70-888(+)|eukprot:CAMPEP_0114235370 /NCGR_PEP_ID=MMETSP0058-20121206/6213_1 /TAXON_ID=36894 /ORGANISM="Pyramimonas parkeae, CCMP726" /LENGTH=272 /DNA_ID=CAMNT_0001347125 /DNA_START=70 /DNA_END=888 /DNA_ORIENTATION=-
MASAILNSLKISLQVRVKSNRLSSSFRERQATICSSTVSSSRRQVFPRSGQLGGSYARTRETSQLNGRISVLVRNQFEDVDIELDDEVYIEMLEKAYANPDEAVILQDRMKEDRAFSIRMKSAMANDLYKERLTAAIQNSSHMQKAIENSPVMKKLQEDVDNNVLLKPFQDEKVLNQLETLQGDPRKISMMMTQSEGKLKQVCEDLVLGVQEYRSEFEPDADDLIEKFGTIARDGYKAFLKIALDDKRVQNAIINALMDAMEEEQAQQTTKE